MTTTKSFESKTSLILNQLERRIKADDDARRMIARTIEHLGLARAIATIEGNAFEKELIADRARELRANMADLRTLDALRKEINALLNDAHNELLDGRHEGEELERTITRGIWAWGRELQGFLGILDAPLKD